MFQTICSPSTTFSPLDQQLRTSDFNTAINNNIVVFNTSNIYVTSNLTGNSVTIVNLTMTTPVNEICDVAMSSINNKIYFSLSVETNLNMCYVTMYNGSTTISYFSTGITVSTTPSFSKIVSKNNKVVMLINSNLMVFSYNATTLSLVSNQSLTTISAFCSLDISYNRLYLVADASSITIYSLTNYSQLYSYNCSLCSITNAKFGFNNYVLFTSLSFVYELDTQINKIIYQMAVVNNYIGWVNSSTQFLNGIQWPLPNIGYQLYQANDTYLCSSTVIGSDANLVCPTCLTTYYLNSQNGLCQKIYPQQS